MNRHDELAANLDAVRSRITAAVGGTSQPVLIVVTKFFPASDVSALAALGVRDVGENRDQEASAKAAETSHDPRCAGLHWHFIGQLQSNKAKSVARYASAVHSIDRASLVKALNKAMEAQGQDRSRAGLSRQLECFIQVNLDDGSDDGPPAAGRGGADPSQVLKLAAAVEEAEHLRLAGVMAVAPLHGDPGAAFSRLAGISGELRRVYPHASAISAGMSSDLEQALEHGATHLRVGSNVLGERSSVR